MTRAKRASLAFAAGMALVSAFVAAAGLPDPEALTGRLRDIKQSGTVRLGYRESTIPFSYVGPDGKPAGYSIDLCQAIAAAIAEELSIAALRVEYVRVTAEDRIERVRTGTVDLECGATTATAERRARVAFSPVMFVTGTRLAVRRDGKLRGVADLRGRSVAVVGGTTNEAAMRELDRLRGTGFRLVAVGDYRDALARLIDRSVDALAADEVLLRGLIAEAGAEREVRVVGSMLSFEPYGIMYARDDPLLADVVERTFRSLAESREIVWLYDRWFVRPLPSGRRLDMPMSQELRRSLELIGLPPD